MQIPNVKIFSWESGVEMDFYSNSELSLKYGVLSTHTQFHKNLCNLSFDFPRGHDRN